MPVLEKVRSFVVLRSPHGVCDHCIQKALGLSVPQHANHKTRELVVQKGFIRRKDVCGTCGPVKEVIRTG